MVSIKEKGKERVLNYVNSAAALYEPDLSLKGDNIGKFFEYTCAISNYINDIDNIGNSEDKIFLIQNSIKEFIAKDYGKVLIYKSRISRKRILY